MHRTTIWRFLRIALLTVAIGGTTLAGPTLAEAFSSEPPSMTEDSDSSMRPPKGGGFEQDDADNNGVVTRDEFSGPADLFDRLDSNGDGQINREEAKPKGGRDGRRP